MSEMKNNQSRLSSNSLSSQTSLAMQVASLPGAGKGKSRKSKDQSPPSSLPPDGGTPSSVGQQQPCSLAIPITSSFSKPTKKQGFTIRDSLRRMLHSPLISQRRARSLSAGNNLGSLAPSSSASATSGPKKRQSPSTCKSSSSTVATSLFVNLSFLHFLYLPARYESESPSDTSSTSQSEIRAAGRPFKDAIAESWECSLCLAECSSEFFPELLSCAHRSCLDCLQQYLRIEISESRVNINCPECSEPMHPNGIN